MTARTDRFIGFDDRALFIDQVTDAFCESGFGVVTRAVREANCSCSIAEQDERKTILLGECGILSDRIEADAENLDVVGAKLVDLVAEPATFSRSARGIGFWIKPQQDFFAVKTGEREVFAFMRLYREIGSCRVNREHMSFPSCLKEQL